MEGSDSNNREDWLIRMVTIWDLRYSYTRGESTLENGKGKKKKKTPKDGFKCIV